MDFSVLTVIVQTPVHVRDNLSITGTVTAIAGDSFISHGLTAWEWADFFITDSPPDSGSI